MDKPNNNASIKSITEKHVWNIHLSVRNLDWDQPFGGCGVVVHGSLWAPVSSSCSRTTCVRNISVCHTPGFQQHSTALKRECHTNFELRRRPIVSHSCMYITFYTNQTHFRLVAYRKVGVTLARLRYVYTSWVILTAWYHISRRRGFNGNLMSPVTIKRLSKVADIFPRS